MSREMKELFDNAPPRKIERRKGLDRRGKIGIALSVAGGVLWTAGLCLAYYGYPHRDNYFDDFFNKSLRTTWDPAAITFALIFWAAGVALSVLSLVQFRKRYRRRSDKKHMGIIVMMALNAISFIMFIIVALVLGF